MYTASGNEELRALVEIPLVDTDAPKPELTANEHEQILTYHLSSDAPVRVKFTHCYIHRFGALEIDSMQPPYEYFLGKPSYEVCAGCEFEFGNDDNPGTAKPSSFSECRMDWKRNKAK